MRSWPQNGSPSKDEDRHAEDVVGGGLVLRSARGFASLAGEVLAIVLGRGPTRDQARDRLRQIDLELALEESLVRRAAVVEEAAVRIAKSPPISAGVVS